jgi:hypothetical protein
MELIVRPDLVGPCPLSEPEDEASSSPGPAKGEPSVLGPGASQGAVPSNASQGAKRHAVETPVKYVPKNGGRARMVRTVIAHVSRIMSVIRYQPTT